MKRGKNNYTKDWQDVADYIKHLAHWKCENCGQKDSDENGCRLTVHHIDMDKSNNSYLNLVALCQRCHLSIQARFTINQQYLFSPPAWVIERMLI